MRELIRAAILLFCVAMAAQLGGCTRSSDAALSPQDTDSARGDRGGYYEINHEGTVYVLGSIQSVDKLRAGQIPPTTSGGFSAQGQAVLFETNDTGMADRLKGEYARRHGLSSQ